MLLWCFVHSFDRRAQKFKKRFVKESTEDDYKDLFITVFRITFKYCFDYVVLAFYFFVQHFLPYHLC